MTLRLRAERPSSSTTPDLSSLRRSSNVRLSSARMVLDGPVAERHGAAPAIRFGGRGGAPQPDPWHGQAEDGGSNIVSDGFEHLIVERRGNVGWLIFDRPDAGNAMNARMLAELERAWIELDQDPDVRVIVNTGNGQAFQTGLDVKQLAKDKDALREQSRRTRDAALKLTGWHNGVWKPIIAAVNGVCAGGGLHFVADADIVLMADGATLVDPHVSVGEATVYETI